MMGQGSKQWFEIRRGSFTSSEIESICKPKGLGQTGETYIMQTLAELLIDYDLEPESFSNQSTKWGNEFEPLAAEVYAKTKNKIIEEMGFVRHPELNYWGGSADRKTYDNETGDDFGIAEIKCPFESSNHLQHCRITSDEIFKSWFPKYYWQCISNMIVNGVKYCDFISFDPRMSKEHGLFVYRLHLSKTDEAFLISRIIEARKLMLQIATEIGIKI